MSKKRAQYSIEFKAKIALAAIRGKETVLQLAAPLDVIIISHNPTNESESI